MGDPGRAPLRLEDAARLCGAYRWLEHQLFALTGLWAETGGQPRLQMLLSSQSFEHAWHAEMWAARFPVLDQMDLEQATHPAGPAMVSLVAALRAGPETPDPSAGPAGIAPEARLSLWRLAALYRVTLPRLVATYERHLALASPVSDLPTIRTLQLVLRDEKEAWRQGDALLRSLLESLAAVSAVARAQEEVEGCVVESGAGAFLVPWPAVPTAPGGS